MKKDIRKYRLLGLLTVLTLCVCLQLSAMPARAAENIRIREDQDEIVTVTVTVPTDELPDSDELFSGYVDKIFYQELNAGISAYGEVGADRLQGEYNKKLYAELKERVAAVAEGKAANTEFTLELDQIGLKTLNWSAQELGLTAITGENVSKAVSAKMGTVIDDGSIIRYLLMDCPYELYWFDKTKGMGIQYAVSYNSQSLQISELKFLFSVAQEYQSGSNEYLMDTSGISRISAAVSNAGKIVKDNENKSDYEKLTAYRQKICELTSYNDSAAGGGAAYGNPWQLIWVFDEDPGTEVVCEGYAKAFQYLCDLSTFDETACYTVTGTMDGGAHMWNLVSFSGNNYLVDVTNCDTGTIGEGSRLFLAGARGTVAGGYTVSCRGTDIIYRYDASQKQLYGEAMLTLSETDYRVPVIVTVPGIENITYGDPVSSGHITGTARTADGKNVPGTFSWTPDVTSYGASGAKTLPVIFRPDDTETYGSENVNVEIMVRKRPITVQARAVSKIYGDADPAFTYDIISGSLVPGDSLKGMLSREKGEDVRAGGYRIEQGTLSHSDYTIDFRTSILTVNPRKTGVAVEIKGDYQYDGTPVIPEVQVKAGGTVFAESAYVMEVRNHTGVGTAVVRISPKPGGNYTWDVIEKKFVINLTGAKKGTTLKSGKVSYKVTENNGKTRTVSCVKADSSKTTIKIPNTVKLNGVTYKVTAIEKKAFKNNKKLTTVTIGANVTSIGAEAFSGCVKLTKITGCEKVLTVGDKAFYGCKKLKQVGKKSSTVTLSKVKTIGKSAFYHCQAIKKVNLTSTALTKIGSSAFNGCTSMTSFSAKSTKLASIGSKAFYKDKKLASVTLKTSKLTKSNTGANVFKGIKSTCKIKVPSKKVKAYKTLCKAKGAVAKIKVSK